MKLDFYLVEAGTDTTVDVAHGNQILNYELIDYYGELNLPDQRIFHTDANPLDIWYTLPIEEYYDKLTKLATHDLLTQYSFDYASYYYLDIVNHKATYPEHFI